MELNTALPLQLFFCLRIFHVTDVSAVSDEYVEQRLLLRLTGKINSLLVDFDFNDT